MTHTAPLPEDIVQALFAYDQALARQERRIALAIEVLEGPNDQTPEEILAAANTLLTYGDSVAVLRATEAIRALMRRQQQAAGPAQGFPAKDKILEAVLWSLIGIGAVYIIAGATVALFSKAFG